MMVATKVALLALCAILVQVQADVLVRPGRELLTFPNCNCTTNTSVSPYRLEYDNATTVTLTEAGYLGEKWFCFRLVLRWETTICNQTNFSSPCCKQDAYKVEWGVNANCKGATNRALLYYGFNNTVLNGTTIYEQIKTIGIDNKTTPAVLRISQLRLSQSLVAAFPGGVPICINLEQLPDVGGTVDKCDPNTLFSTVPGQTTNFFQYSVFNSNKKCCPTAISPLPPGPPAIRDPPPPSPSPASSSPPSPPPFPFCVCNNYSSDSFPWRISGPTTVSADADGKPAERVCLQLYYTNIAGRCDINNGCCTSPLPKVEIVGSPACKNNGTVTQVTLNGAQTPHVWGTSAVRPGIPVLKFTKLNLAYAPAQNGSSLCFTLRGPSCNKWADLCAGGTCQAATFSPEDACCPQLTLASSP